MDFESWTLETTNKKIEAQNRKSFEMNSPANAADNIKDALDGKSN